jgi:hypothetical protein
MPVRSSSRNTACTLGAAIASTAAPTFAEASEGCSTLGPAGWLIGTWTATSGKRKGGESLRLVAMTSAVHYIAIVAHNALPVPFELTPCATGQLVFENPRHDFPRRLEYTHAAPERMTVRVSDGAAKAFTLDFRRTP